MSDDDEPESDADALLSRDDAECALALAGHIAEVIAYAEAHGYFGVHDCLVKAKAEAERIAAQGGRTTLLN